MRCIVSILMLVASVAMATTNFTLLYPPANSGHFSILSNGRWKSVVMFDQPNNQVNLFSYSPGGRTNYLTLPSISRNNTVAMLDSAMQSNKLYVAGISGGAPLPYVYEYTLTDDGTLPTSATFVTNFQIGTGSPQFSTAQLTMSVLTNGGVGVFTFPVGTGTNTIGAYYRRPSDGVWTNMTAVSSVNSNSLPEPQFPARLSSAEDPVDQSLFLFMTKDSSQAIWGAKYVTTSNGTEGLYLVQTNYVVHGQGSNVDIYGEYPPVEAVPDPYHNGILLTYPSWDYQDYTPAYYGDTPIVSLLFSNNFTSSLISLSTNTFVQRLSGALGSAVGAATITTLMAGDYYFYNLNQFPIMQQTISNGVPAAPVIVGYQYGTNSTMYGPATYLYNDPIGTDVAFRNTNGVWNLLATLTNSLPAVRNLIIIGKSTVGKASM